jgi:photosystem II stability/assembly factor-like uncharacterized protein
MQRRPLRLWFLLALAASVPDPAPVRAQGWTSGGPYGGRVGALATSPAAPGQIYVATADGGVFRTTNSGASWMASTGLPTLLVNAVAVDPHEAGTVYAGLNAHGLFRSTDGGTSWVAANAGLPGAPLRSVLSMAIAASDGTKLYVGAHASSNAGIYRSTNSGASWQAGAGTPGSAPRVLVVNPSSPTTVFAGFDSYGIYRSADAGATWSSTGYAGDVQALAVDPLDAVLVYASIRSTGSIPSGVYKSTDAGQSFELANAGLTTGSASSLVVDPTAPATLYAGTALGVFKSTNAGGSWAPASASFLESVDHLLIDPTAPATLYAAAKTGIGPELFMSMDAGATWAPTHVGLNNVSTFSVVAVPSAPGTVLAGTRSGAFRTTDAGATWARLPLWATNVWTLAVAPRAPAMVYAGGDGFATSTDGGASWTLVAAPSTPVRSLAVDSAIPTSVYAGTETGIARSTNSGATWEPLVCDCDVVNALVVDHSTPTRIFAGDATQGVFRSTNGGSTWLPVNTGLTDLWVQSLALDPASPATLYAGTYHSGVFKSTNSGGSWAPATTGLPLLPVRALVVDPAAPHTVYAGLLFAGERANGTRGVFRSTDGGASWHNVSRGLGVSGGVRGLALDSAGRLFAGLERRSVWQAGTLPAAFAKGDVNLDGQPDLLLRRVGGVESQAWIMDGVQRVSTAAVVPDAPHADWQIRGVDDFTGDAVNDLVFRNQATGEVVFWVMNGAARVGGPVALTGAGSGTLGQGWDLSATADVNHDGAPDLVRRNVSSQKIVVQAMDGLTGYYLLAPTPDQAADANWAIVAALDYDDDGNTDFLWYNATSGKLVTWYLDASLVRTAGQFTTPAAAADTNWKVVASADYSRTYAPGTPPLGSPDIVWRNDTSGNQVVWHMDFASTRVHGQFTNPPANELALDWTIVGPR